MYLPPLQLTRNDRVYVSGDVTIDSSAAIAPGVILQANPGSRIAIAAGVCIGMGSIIKVYEGSLVIESGATIGAGVLAIGAGKIGANASIGTATTILNPAIEPARVVPAGSVVGDESRQWAEIQASEVDKGAAELSELPIVESEVQTGVYSSPSSPTADQPTQNPEAIAPDPPAVQPKPDSSGGETSEGSGAEVPGQKQINRLLLTLFPHNNTWKQPIKGGQDD